MDTPALEQLMGAYLHQDYDAYGTVEENVDRFVREAPDVARRLPDEVAWVLGTYESEERLEDFADRIGCDVGPIEGEGGWRGWLIHIANRVRTQLAAGPP